MAPTDRLVTAEGTAASPPEHPIHKTASRPDPEDRAAQTAAARALTTNAEKPPAERVSLAKKQSERVSLVKTALPKRSRSRWVRFPRRNPAPARSLLDGEPTVPAWVTADSTRGGPRHRLVAAALAAASGTVLVAAFPPYELWWLAPIAVAMLALAVRRQPVWFGALLGALHGAAFFGPLLHWTGIYVGPAPWLMLTGLQTVFLSLLGAVAALTSRLPAWTLPPVTAALWVGQEALRARIPFGGFPWGRVAFSQDGSPLLHLARLAGAPAVTFAVALIGGLLAAAATMQRGYPWARVVQRAVVLLGAAGVIVLGGLFTPLPAADGKTVTVAVVQGNVPRLGLDFNAQRRAVLDNHVNATRDLADRVDDGAVRRPDLVIWPENASDIDPLQNPDARALIQDAADRIDAPILVGAVLNGPGKYVSNAGIVWQPRTGPGEQYVKRHPVPFAEYMPMRELARRVSDKVDLVRRDFRGGDEIGTLQMGPATVGDVICFEVAYDGLVTDTVNSGAQLLVVQTNNATFGRSAESAQQLAMVRLRAIEHGRPAVMASTSGVSATMDSTGRILDRSGLFEPAVFVRDLRLSEHRTLATMLGGWPELLISLLALGAVASTAVAGWISSRRTRRSTRPPPTDPPAESAPTATTPVPPPFPEEDA